MKSILSLLAGCAVSVAVAATPASALTYTYTYDSPSDASGGNQWEIYSLGYAVDGGSLHFNLVTGYNFSSAANMGGDSYSGNTVLSPGDLYINVGGSRNAGTGSSFGLGMTTHSGDMTADPSDNGYPWSAVVAGHLYGNAVFATGTYEGYAGADQFSEDGGNDPFGHANNLPTLIAGYGSALGFQGATSFSLLNGGGSVQVNPNGTTRSNVYSFTGSILLSALGLSNGGAFELMWAPECGNDAIIVSGNAAVPEPATLGLLSLGLFGARAFSRRRPA